MQHSTYLLKPNCLGGSFLSIRLKNYNRTKKKKQKLTIKKRFFIIFNKHNTNFCILLGVYVTTYTGKKMGMYK